MSQLNDGPKPCDYCGSHTHLHKHDGTVFVFCPSCFANGPHVRANEHDAEGKAITRFNANKLFGRIAAANVPFGMPSETMAIAERLKLIGESITNGCYGFPKSFVLIFRQDNNANVLTHNIQDRDVGPLLSGVLDSVRALNKVGT